MRSVQCKTCGGECGLVCRGLGFPKHVPAVTRVSPKNSGGVSRSEKKAQAPRKSNGGRPRIGEEGRTLKALAPWKALNMSERTWYRREAERKALEARDE